MYLLFAAVGFSSARHQRHGKNPTEHYAVCNKQLNMSMSSLRVVAKLIFHAKGVIEMWIYGKIIICFAFAVDATTVWGGTNGWWWHFDLCSDIYRANLLLLLIFIRHSFAILLLLSALMLSLQHQIPDLPICSHQMHFIEMHWMHSIDGNPLGRDSMILFTCHLKILFSHFDCDSCNGKWHFMFEIITNRNAETSARIEHNLNRIDCVPCSMLNVHVVWWIQPSLVPMILVVVKHVLHFSLLVCICVCVRVCSCERERLSVRARSVNDQRICSMCVLCTIWSQA